MTPKFCLVSLVARMLASTAIFVASGFVRAEDVAIPEVSRDKVVVPSESGRYYVVQAAERLEDAFDAGELYFGDGAERSYLFDFSGARKSGFFRVTIADVAFPADIDGDGIDDLYEFERPEIFNVFDGSDAFVDFDKDGRSNLWEYQNAFDPGVSDVLTTFFSSPHGGESDVAVTRETVLSFSRPLQRNPNGLEITAESGGKKLRTRLLTSSDKRTVTVFYPDLLPGSSRVRLTLQGGSLRDAAGGALDPDRDGLAGGVGVVEFDTLSLTTVPKTAVYGRVFASEVGETGVEAPLSGGRVYVDGREKELFAFTDAFGAFRLEPVPVGTFFVHIDGKVAQGQTPHEGYYPLVGKAWQSEAGRETSVGEIYLPLIREGTLAPIGASGETVVRFPAAVLATHPELVGVHLNVPAGALVSQFGSVPGSVGIAPVDPNRLPGPLPEGLSLPLVITVQSNGPGNFDTPVPGCFPNLPDPETGETLPPGAKSALWSFDHDAGRWVVMGSMTVSSDGKLVCTDPGVGIVAPGWHGAAPGVDGRDGEIVEDEEEDPCESGPIEISYQDEGFFIFRIATPGFKGHVKWSAPSAFPDEQIGNVLQAEYCEAGTYTVSAFLIRPGARFPCHSETITVTVTEEDVAPLTIEFEEITDPNDNRGLGVYRATSSRKGLFIWTAEGDGDTSIKTTPSADGLSETAEIRFCSEGDYVVKAGVFDRCGASKATEDFPVVVASVPPVEFRETLHREDEGGPVDHRTIVAASVFGNVVGNWTVTVTPSEGVVRKNVFAGSDTLYDEATDSTIFAAELIFCKTGSYSVTLNYEDELCGQFLTDTIEMVVAEAGHELKDGITTPFGELAPGARTVGIGAEIDGDVKGTWTWSVTPTEGVKLILPEVLFGGENSIYSAESDETISLIALEFCEDGEYTVRLVFVDTECGDRIEETRTFTASAVSPEFEDGIITPFGDLGPGLRSVALVAEIKGNIKGTWTWSVTPSAGVKITPPEVILGGENFLYSAETDETISYALLEFCEDGLYTARLVFVDEACGKRIEETRVFNASSVAPEFVNGITTPFGNMAPGKRTLAVGAEIKGDTKGTWSWSVTPAAGVVLTPPEVLLDGQSSFYSSEDDETISLATLDFCEEGAYTVTLRFVDAICGKVLTETKTVVASALDNTLVNGIEISNTGSGPGNRLVSVFSKINGEARGTWTWSVSPTQGVTLITPEILLDGENAIYDAGDDFTRSFAGLEFCSPGEYTVRLAFHDPVCGEDVVTTQTINTNTFAMDFTGVDCPPATSEAPPQLQTGGTVGDGSALVPAKGRFFYYLKNLKTGRVSRGKAGSNGFAHPSGIRLRPNTRYEELVLDANTLRIARATWKTPDSGNIIELPRFILGSVIDDEDRDFDGLSDLAELIMGTNPEDSDTDDDGLLDGPEVLLGTNPNDRAPLGVGLVNELALDGVTVDVCAVGDYAVTASGAAGVHIVNIFNGRFPVLIGTVDTPGDAQAVACGERHIAVADGPAGLAIIELRDPANESTLARTVGLGSDAVCVAVGADLVYVGLENGEVVVVEIATGRILNRVQLEQVRVEDLVLAQGQLFALQRDQLFVFDIGSGVSLVQRHAVDTKGEVGAGNLRMRLFAGNGYLLLTHARGYNTFEIGADGFPKLIAAKPTQQFGWKQVVSGGSGLAVAAVGANSTLDGDHHIAIYNDSDLAKTNEFIEEVTTPGTARVVALANGLAYVADSASGLSVAAYHDVDTGGLAPSLQLSHNFATGQVEENGLLVVTADAADDVQVRDVQFSVNGVAQKTDGSYPYQLTMRAPALSAVSTVSISAIARDTSGNTSSPVELVLEVVADATPVEVFWVTPAKGADEPADGSLVLSMQFSDPVANFAELENLLQLFDAGDDGILDTEDDISISLKVTYNETQRAVSAKPESNLASGQYRARLLKGLKDGQGRAIQEDFEWTFTVVGVRIESFEPKSAAPPYTVRRIVARADRPLKLSTITSGSLTLERVVEGGQNVPLDGAITTSLTDAKAFELTLKRPLPPGVYQATARGARDLLGGQIPETVWQFEVLPGRATRSTPGIGQIADSGLEEASVVFNISLDPETISGGIELRKGTSDGDVVPVAALSYVGLERRILARFAQPLAGGEYVWVFTGSLRDFEGAELGEPNAELRFKVSVPATTVRGVVVDAEGSPVENAIVSITYFDLEADSAEPNQHVSVFTDTEGAFTYVAAAVGEIKVVASKETVTQGARSSAPQMFAANPGGEVDLGQLILLKAGFSGNVATGYGHTLWVDSGQALWGVGSNDRGQLGNGESGEFLQAFSPISIGGNGKAWKRVAAGRDHSLAIDKDGSLWAWGANAFGQLGDGGTTDSLTPMQVGTGWADIDAGGWFSVGIQSDGTLWEWGYAPHGKVTGVKRESVLSPEQIGTDNDWAFVDAGMGYVLALKSDGSLWAWGANGDGQLGDGTEIDRLEPIRIGSDSNWEQVVAGFWHSLGIRSDGTLWAWGSNVSRQLGDGSRIDQATPIQISSDSDWVEVSCSGSFSLGRKADGSIWFWGDSSTANLPGVSFQVSVPTKSSFEGAAFVSAGLTHTVYGADFGNVQVRGFIFQSRHTIIRSDPGLGTDQPYRTGYETMEIDFLGDLDPAGALPVNITWLNSSRSSSFAFLEGKSLTFKSGTSKLVVRPSTALNPASFYNLTFGAGLIDVAGEAQGRTNLQLFSMNAPSYRDHYPENFGKVPVGDVTQVSVSSEAPIKADSIEADGLRLFDLGPDGLFETADDIEISGTVVFDETENRIRLELAEPLPLGSYYAEPSASVRTTLNHSFLRRVFGTTIRNFWFFSVNEGPEIVDSSPSDQSTYFYDPNFDQFPPTSFTLTFSQTEMDATTLTTAHIRLREGAIDGFALAPDSVSYDPIDRILIVMFAEPLEDGTYFIELSPDIKDTKGRKLIPPIEPIQFGVRLSDFGGGS